MLAVLLTASTMVGCKDSDSDPVGPPPPPPPPETQMIGWTVTAANMAGAPGAVIRLVCEPNGRAATIRGTLVYTDDSSICTAAVHSGLIGMVGGGAVEITIQDRQVNYPGSSKNGITSGYYGAWNRGFSFGAVTVEKAEWSTTMTTRRGRNNDVFVLDCPANGVAGSIWGTSVYTDDSSVCTAAVHDGLITRASGGRVFVAVRPGRSSYTASTRNGVTSRSYGSWVGSFDF